MVPNHSLPPSNTHSPDAKLYNNSFTTRIFSDVAGDITIVVDGESFLLHKFPLVGRCGKIRKLVSSTKDTSLSTLELEDFPGGPHTFELTMMFCYGMNFQITTSNVAHLHYAAQFLEMTEEFREDNLISRTEAYLNEVVFQSLDKSVQVLKACEAFCHHADEEVRIMRQCVESIALNACKEELVSGLSRLEFDERLDSEVKGNCVDWWVEDLSTLGINSYKRVICAMGRVGVHPNSIVMSVMHYAQSSIKGLGTGVVLTKPNPMLGEQRMVVEALVSLLPSSSVQLSFLFGMLRMATMIDATAACRVELERRVASRLEMVSLDDLLIPSLRPGDSLFDIDTVHRILVCYLQRVQEEEDNGYESDVVASPGHASLLKVGCLIDAYLAEIAPDPYLSLIKFSAIIQILPDYARVMDDALYRAIDIYMKAHPMLTEHECMKLCKLIDCQKLSQEASNHAAQNDRLPLQMTVRVLYFEQIRLKTALSGDGFLSNNKMSSSAAIMSPKDNYASLRRENRDLKLEISRMRVRLSELEKEQMLMKQGMISKPGKTLLSSISNGIRIFKNRQKSTQGKTTTGRRNRKDSLLEL